MGDTNECIGRDEGGGGWRGGFGRSSLLVRLSMVNGAGAKLVIVIVCFSAMSRQP